MNSHIFDSNFDFSAETLSKELESEEINIVDYVSKICFYLADLSVQVATFKNIFSQKILKCSIKSQHAHEALKLFINDILLEITEMVSKKLNRSEMTDDQLSTGIVFFYKVSKI